MAISVTTMPSSTSNHSFLEFPQIKPPLLMMGGKTLKWKPNSAIEVAPSCPRCFSSNTKFCYYNNYSVSQPRYFCKACRRYWTKGGSLRNVPIGGGCRKTRRTITPAAASRLDTPSPPPAAPESDFGANAVAAPPKNVVNDNYEGSNFAAAAAMFECGGGVGVMGGGDEQLGQVHGCFEGQDFVYENFGVLGTEMFPNLEGFGCGQAAPLMEMQEFEVFSSGNDDDRVRTSYENLMTGNWGPFDLSAYENF